MHFLLTDDSGWHFQPHVTGFTSSRDPQTLRRVFAPDPEVRIPIGFFVHGAPYKLFGLIPADIHLIGPIDPTQPFYLLGADRLGRDVFSRLDLRHPRSRSRSASSASRSAWFSASCSAASRATSAASSTT